MTVVLDKKAKDAWGESDIDAKARAAWGKSATKPASKPAPSRPLDSSAWWKPNQVQDRPTPDMGKAATANIIARLRNGVAAPVPSAVDAIAAKLPGDSVSRAAFALDPSGEIARRASIVRREANPLNEPENIGRDIVMQGLLGMLPLSAVANAIASKGKAAVTASKLIPGVAKPLARAGVSLAVPAIEGAAANTAFVLPDLLTDPSRFAQEVGPNALLGAGMGVAGKVLSKSLTRRPTVAEQVTSSLPEYNAEAAQGRALDAHLNAQEATTRGLGLTHREIRRLDSGDYALFTNGKQGVTFGSLEVAKKGYPGVPITDAPPLKKITSPRPVTEPQIAKAEPAPTNMPIETPVPESAPVEASPVVPEISRAPMQRMGYDLLDPKTIDAAPNELQYKADTDTKGVTRELKSVEQWDANKAGVMLVWKNPADGKTYVVNGHHRLELAQRLGVEGVMVKYIDAPDAAGARKIGALTNIAEGRGTAIDAAKVIRDGNITSDQLAAEGVSLSGKIASDGIELAKLNDNLFNDVVQKRISTSRAVTIARTVSDHAQQQGLYDLLKQKGDEGERMNDGEVAELARFVQTSPTVTTTQVNLFGEEQIRQNLAVEKAKLSNWVKEQFRKQTRGFKPVADQGRADLIADAGNTLNVEENARRAVQAQRDLEIYDTLSLHTGPVAEALNAAAERLAAGEKITDVRTELFGQVVPELRQVASGRTELRGPVDSGVEGQGVGSALRVERGTGTDGPAGGSGEGVTPAPVRPASAPIEGKLPPNAGGRMSTPEGRQLADAARAEAKSILNDKSLTTKERADAYEAAKTKIDQIVADDNVAARQRAKSPVGDIVKQKQARSDEPTVPTRGMPQNFQGDAIKYTGNKTTRNGITSHEAEFIEGHRKGEKIDILPPGQRSTPPSPPPVAAKPEVGAKPAAKPSWLSEDTHAQVEAARERWNQKGSVGPRNEGGGIDPKADIELIHSVGRDAYKHVGDNAEAWRKAVVDYLGEHVVPYLDDAWKAIRPGSETSGRSTGIKNDITRAEAELYGIPETQRGTKMTNIRAAKDALAIHETDPARAKSLVEDLIARPRVASNVENHLLDFHRVDTLNDWMNAPEGAKKEALFKDLQDNQLAAAISKQNVSAAMSSFKSVVKPDYSLATMMAIKRAEVGAEGFTPEVQAQVKADVAKYDALQKTYDDHMAQYEAERAKWDAERKTRSTVPAGNRLREAFAGKLNTKHTIERHTVVDARLKEIFQTGAINPSKGGITPETNALIREAVAFHVERGINTFAELRKVMVEAYGEKVLPYLSKHWSDETNAARLQKSNVKANVRAFDKWNAERQGKELPPKSPPIKYDRKAMHIRDELKQATATLDGYGNKPKRDYWDLIPNLQREAILSSPPVIAKLITYDIWHVTTEAIADIASPLIGRIKVPGAGGIKVRVRDIPGVVEGAPYTDIIRANSKGLKQILSREMLRNIRDYAKTGTAMTGRIRGDNPHKAEFGGIVGRTLHGTVKTIVDRFAFERALEIQIRQAKRLGLDYTDPAWQEQAQFVAATEGNRAQLQNKNKAGDALGNAIAGVARAGTGGKIAAAGLKILLPIRNIPMNIVGRTAQTITPIGVSEGIFRQIRMSKVFKDTGELPTPEEVGKMARAYRYAGLGGLAAYLGLSQPSWFKSSGNDWKNPNKDNKDKRMDSGSFQIFGAHIPVNEAHHSFLEAVQMWATIRQDYDKSKDPNKINALLDGFLSVGTNLAENLPGVITASMMGSTPNPRAAAGVVVSSVAVPGVVKYAAKLTDKIPPKDAGLLAWMRAPVQSRKPQGFVDELKYGVPGLRKQVPIKKSKKASGSFTPAKLSNTVQPYRP